MNRGWIIIPLAVLVAGSCTEEVRSAVEGLMPIATVLEVMEAITIPAADRLWAGAAEPPVTDEEWKAVENAAIAVAESGNLLLMEGRALDVEEWPVATRNLIAASVRALEAARARDETALGVAGDQVYESCLACHQLYMHPLYDQL